MLRIDYYRKKKGLTVDALAAKIGTTRGNLQKIKKKPDFSSDWLLKIARALEVSPAELLPLEWQKSTTTADINEPMLIDSIYDMLEALGVKIEEKVLRRDLSLAINLYKNRLKKQHINDESLIIALKDQK